MLQRALMSRARSSLLGFAPMRAMHTAPGTNFAVPESVEDVVQSLDK